MAILFELGPNECAHGCQAQQTRSPQPCSCQTSSSSI
jgi:hypothetical protein